MKKKIQFYMTLLSIKFKKKLWDFFKILYPSQNIRTLAVFIDSRSFICLATTFNKGWQYIINNAGLNSACQKKPLMFIVIIFLLDFQGQTKLTSCRSFFLICFCPQLHIKKSDPRMVSCFKLDLFNKILFTYNLDQERLCNCFST